MAALAKGYKGECTKLKIVPVNNFQMWIEINPKLKSYLYHVLFGMFAFKSGVGVHRHILLKTLFLLFAHACFCPSRKITFGIFRL